TFHDGTPFDAAAVKFNLERQRVSPYNGSGLKNITAVDVVDPVRDTGLRLVRVVRPLHHHKSQLPQKKDLLSVRAKALTIIPSSCTSQCVSAWASASRFGWP
ncbi:MAG: hypothetical protein D4R44_04750, partial [Actinobacteria bacterium]